MPQSCNNTDQNQAESKALVKSDNNGHTLTVKGKGSLLALTDSVVSKAIAARKTNQLEMGYSWMQKIWDWADKFELPESQIPRNKKALIALEELDISTTPMQKRINMSMNMYHYASPTNVLDKQKQLDYFSSQKNTGYYYIPQELTLLSNLTYLSIDKVDSGISCLLENIGRLSNLTNLTIIDNSIDGLLHSILQLKNLEYLYLSRNQLKSLPENINQLKLLKGLTISDNHIGFLPDSIGEMVHLKHLSFRSTRINTLPKSIYKLKKLIFLDLSFNNITSLSENINHFSKLTYLSIECNQLLSLPKNVVNLRELKTLNVSNNVIVSLPQNISKLTKLNTLEFEGNPASKLIDDYHKYLYRKFNKSF